MEVQEDLVVPEEKMRRRVKYDVRGNRTHRDNTCRRQGFRSPGVRFLAWAVILPALLARGHAKYSGGDGTAETPYLLASASDLATLATAPHDWAAHFKLTAHVDMADLSAQMANPIGDRFVPFRGTFDGGNKKILNFRHVSSQTDDVGLFGFVRGSATEIRNVHLVEPHVQCAGANAGALVGQFHSGTVRNCRVERARIAGHRAVGGLVGWNQGAIFDCRVSGEITGEFSVGGLAGITFWGDGIRRCRADATVSGVNRVGGLVGACGLAEIHWCASTGRVEAESNAGGLVGAAEGAIVQNCYSWATVLANDRVGGLIGSNGPSCQCSAGALPSEVAFCYATGLVSGQSATGGLVGVNEDSEVVASFWDIEASGRPVSAGGTGGTTAQLQSPLLFLDAGWNFAATQPPPEFWIVKNGSYPRGAWEAIKGDFDEDGDIDLRDFAFLAVRWRSPDASFRTGGTDLTDDERTDLRDLEALATAWLRDR